MSIIAALAYKKLHPLICFGWHWEMVNYWYLNWVESLTLGLTNVFNKYNECRMKFTTAKYTVLLTNMVLLCPSYVKEVSLTKTYVYWTGIDLTLHSSIFSSLKCICYCTFNSSLGRNLQHAIVQSASTHKSFYELHLWHIHESQSYVPSNNMHYTVISFTSENIMFTQKSSFSMWLWSGSNTHILV